MTIRNAAEESVRREYERLLPAVPDFCGCEICRADVLVYALNRIPPHYVSTLAGNVLSEFRLDKDQSKVNVDVVLLEGFRRVGRAPRCQRPRVFLP